MTCIVGIKTDEGVYIGGDRLASTGLTGRDYKMKKVFEKDEKFIYGCCGSIRMSQLIQHTFKEPKRYEDEKFDEYLYKRYTDELSDMLKNNRYLHEKDGVASFVESNYILGYDGRLFIVHMDLSVLEPADDFITTGSGGWHSEAVLLFLKDEKKMTPKEKIKKSIEIASQRVLSVDNKVDIVFLPNNKEKKDG
jgi:ATP-dependent protease HslVU (ClpYQ) peptidase subunit